MFLKPRGRNVLNFKQMNSIQLLYASSLWARRAGDRMPVGARFSAPIQNGPGVNPASYVMGAVSLPGVKRSGRGVDHTPHLASKLKKE
jgi:hypothetical protein